MYISAHANTDNKSSANSTSHIYIHWKIRNSQCCASILAKSKPRSNNESILSSFIIAISVTASLPRKLTGNLNTFIYSCAFRRHLLNPLPSRQKPSLKRRQTVKTTAKLLLETNSMQEKVDNYENGFQLQNTKSLPYYSSLSIMGMSLAWLLNIHISVCLDVSASTFY